MPDMAKKKNYTADGSDGTNGVEGAARTELRQFIERIERLEEEKKTIADDIKEVFGEAKGRGYDTKAIRSILKIRKQDPDERQEQNAILDVYLAALGMIEGPPDDGEDLYENLGGKIDDQEEI
jgi:uncharacterized protein (UPF0335 family)